MAAVALPGGVVSLSAENTDRLLALGQGDSALLYLALLRHGGELAPARQALGWTQGRLEAAYSALQGAALVGPAPARAETVDRRLPEYVTQDVVAALAGDPSFAALQGQVEKALGAILSPADLKALYTLYDYLGLPAEVIYLLTSWCVEQAEEKYGPGRRPRMTMVKKEAFRWHDRGIDTLPAAEAFLKSQQELTRRERKLLPLLGVRDRKPVDREREYIAAWVDWGFPDESIRLAYEKTLLKKQEMSWPYMNSILKNWHAKGVHTPREIKAGDAAPTPPPGKVPAQTGRSGPQQENRERMARNAAAMLKRARRIAEKAEGES